MGWFDSKPYSGEEGFRRFQKEQADKARKRADKQRRKADKAKNADESNSPIKDKSPWW